MPDCRQRFQPVAAPGCIATFRSVEDERVAVVTGGGSGIGLATAELFVERGWAVVVNDLAPVDGFETVVGDVSQDDVNTALVDRAIELFGRLDAAVLNAAIVGSPPLGARGSIDRLDAILAVNVRGVALGIAASVPELRKTGGSIVATASTSGLRGDPGNWAYNASKAAVVNLVRAAALDNAVAGVRVNAVAPGPTATGMTKALMDDSTRYAMVAERVPMQRFGVPREQAEVIFFLASPAASFVTGVTIPCDGGVSANANHFALPGKVD
jgi:meso-butanediol dehydrogenase / (S,S)-butanediol dehydrogenase / diacetyl reductase